MNITDINANHYHVSFLFSTALVVSLYYLMVYYGSRLYIILNFTQYPKTPTHRSSPFLCDTNVLYAEKWKSAPKREKFSDNFRISGRSFGPNFGFPYTFYAFSLLAQLNIGKRKPA